MSTPPHALPFASIGSMLTRLRRGARRRTVPAEVGPPPSIRHRVYWNDGAIHWSDDPGGKTDAGFASVPLEVGQTCRFRITAPKPRLASLAVKVGTYCRTNVGRLVCRIHRPLGTVLASADTDLATLRDNAFQAVLDLSCLAFEEGQDYWVELALAADPGNEIAVYVAAEDPRGSVPHRRIEGFKSDDTIEVGSLTRGLLPRYRLDWMQRDAMWSTWPTVSDEDALAYAPCALEFRKAFEFEIVAPVRRPRALLMQLATFERRARAHLVTELLGSGSV